MSRQAPSTITPPSSLSCAASDNRPPQAATSMRPPLSTTITSAGAAAAIAAVHRCCLGFSSPTGSILTVTQRPVTRGHGHRGRMPSAAPFRPRRSSASDTAQVSSLASLATASSEFIAPFSCRTIAEISRRDDLTRNGNSLTNPGVESAGQVEEGSMRLKRLLAGTLAVAATAILAGGTLAQSGDPLSKRAGEPPQTNGEAVSKRAAE